MEGTIWIEVIVAVVVMVVVAGVGKWIERRERARLRERLVKQAHSKRERQLVLEQQQLREQSALASQRCKTQQAESVFSVLPYELQIAVLSHLASLDDLRSAALTCQEWAALVRDDLLWFEVFQRCCHSWPVHQSSMHPSWRHKFLLHHNIVSQLTSQQQQPSQSSMMTTKSGMRSRQHEQQDTIAPRRIHPSMMRNNNNSRGVIGMIRSVLGLSTTTAMDQVNVAALPSRDDSSGGGHRVLLLVPAFGSIRSLFYSLYHLSSDEAPLTRTGTFPGSRDVGGSIGLLVSNGDGDNDGSDHQQHEKEGEEAECLLCSLHGWHLNGVSSLADKLFWTTRRPFLQRANGLVFVVGKHTPFNSSSSKTTSSSSSTTSSHEGKKSGGGDEWVEETAQTLHFVSEKAKANDDDTSLPLLIMVREDNSDRTVAQISESLTLDQNWPGPWRIQTFNPTTLHGLAHGLHWIAQNNRPCCC